MSAPEAGDLGPDEVVDAALAEMLTTQLDAVNRPAEQPAVAAAREVGAVMRAVIDRLTATSAPPEILLEAAGRLRAVSEMLEPYDAIRRYEGVSEASGLAHDRAFFDWSPLLGLANPLAPPIRVTVSEGRVVVGRVTFGLAYEGPPGCVHGGYIAAAFDEVLGLTQSLSGRVGMTGTLTIRYRRPTPLHRELRFEGRVQSASGRKLMTQGELYAGDELTAEASGLFITISPEKFRSLAGQREAAGEAAGGGG